MGFPMTAKRRGEIEVCGKWNPFWSFFGFYGFLIDGFVV